MDAEAIRDIFRGLGLIHIRRMFGGHGIYQGELMFALETGGELYLKVDSETVELFRDMGSRPFVYQSRDGRTSTMSYWLMPESALDDPDEAAQLAGLSLQAAQRAKAATARKTAPRRQARRSAANPLT
jgi:DNA transformation protein